MARFLKSDGVARELGARPVELLVGSSMLIIGALLPWIGESSGVGIQTVSTLLVGLSGVMLSYVGTSIKTQKEAAKEFRVRLGGISSQLAASVEQLRSALLQLQSESTTLETFSTVVSFSCQDLTLIFSQIQALSSEGGISAQEIQRAEETLREVGRIVPALEAALETGHTDVVNDELEEIKTALQRLAEVQQAGQAAPINTPRKRRVKCENCGQETSVYIAPSLGASAHTTCENCRTALHVHVSISGIFSRVDRSRSGLAPVERTDARTVASTCPSCHTELTIAAPREGLEVQRVCAACLLELTVETTAGDVISTEPLNQVAGNVVGRQGSRPVAECETCGRRLVASLRRDGATGEEFFAWCRPCRSVLGPLSRFTPDEMANTPNVRVE